MTPDQIKALIDKLLETGQVLSTKAFELAVRQIYVWEITAIMFAVISLLVILSMAWLMYKTRQDDWDEDWQILWVGVAVISFMVFINSVMGAVQYALNPQWYAVKLLIDTFLAK